MMKLEDILSGIKTDSTIDKQHLDVCSISIPNLHGKWINILVHERVTARTLEIKVADLMKNRTLYYLGKASDEVYKNEPLHHKILKHDLPMWLDSDEKLNEAKNSLYTQTLKISAIESFLKELSQRSFHIRNALEDIKFKAGG